MDQTNHASAKYAFLYMLSLAALIFTGLSVGIIIFQIINKYIPDAIDQFRASFDTGALRFAISALLVAAPVFFITNRFIFKGLYTGQLPKEAGVRKWLTYFILLVSSVVVLGWFIALINSFLGGELTTKFILKALTSIVISSLGFSFYLYDIRRDQVAQVKDGVIQFFFYLAIVIVIAAFTLGLVFGESPSEARRKKLDSAILSDFDQLDSAINQYYLTNKKLPASLEVIDQKIEHISEDNLRDPETGQPYQYQAVDSDSYQLCAVFRTSNLDSSSNDWSKTQWPHDKGEQCIEKTVQDSKGILEPIMIR